MIIELISIGDELLKGIIVNTNAAFLCQKLQQRGYPVARQMTISDEPKLLKAAFAEVLSRADLVIATGGLGSTLDDRTRVAAAELFHSDFHYDETVANELKRRYSSAFEAIEDQATVPSKAKVLINHNGTAPGLIFSEEGKHLVLLPGVPREMEPLFLEQVFPFIEKQWPVKESKATVQLYFCLVYESLLDPHLRALCKQYPAVEAGIYPSHGLLSVHLHSYDTSQLTAFEKALDEKFGSYRYFSPSGRIEEAVHGWFTQNRKTLAFAESCTGGLMSAHVTSMSGASEYFLGSLVTYSNGMKEKILGVSKETIAKHGAVSAETVKEMLAGTFERCSADFAVAVSGIAGPTGGTTDKPVGTVWAAIGERGKASDVGTFLAKGSRQMIVLYTTHFLLGSLWRKAAKGAKAFEKF